MQLSVWKPLGDSNQRGQKILPVHQLRCEHQCTLREDWMAKVLHQIMGGVAYLHSLKPTLFSAG